MGGRTERQVGHDGLVSCRDCFEPVLRRGNQMVVIEDEEVELKEFS
jgi:hypothetical protein